MTKTQEVIEEIAYSLEAARRRYIEYLRDLVQSATHEIKSLEKSPKVMPSSSCARDLMCLSRARKAQHTANEMFRLSEQIRILKYLSKWTD